MAIQSYKVYYGKQSVGLTELTNVQSINFTVGRRNILDQYNASTATVVMRYPTGYASPIAALIPGTPIQIKNAATGYRIFFGTINDAQVNYGMPYSGGVGNADYMTLSIVGAMAEWGRRNTTAQAYAANSVVAQLTDVDIATNLVAEWYGNAAGGYPNVSATTVSTNYGDYLNELAVTRNSRINDVTDYSGASVDYPRVVIIDPYLTWFLDVAMSDTLNNTTNQVYDKIEFSSLSENYYTQVIVRPEAVATQTTQTGSAPYRTYSVNTLSASTTDALGYAEMLLNLFSDPAVQITSISCLANAQNVYQLDRLNLPGYSAIDLIGSTLTIGFRGATYTAIIEGYTFSATPGEARYTYYLSTTNYGAFLELGNTITGRLDYGRLGY